MEPELSEYFEQQYAGFERAHLQGEHFWRAPIAALKDTKFFHLFEQFRRLFPDHPDENNTLFYVLRGPRSGGYTALLVCTRFEHTSLEDIRALVDFLEQAGSSVEHHSTASIDFLGGETLVVCFYEASDSTVNLIQKHATRTTA